MYTESEAQETNSLHETANHHQTEELLRVFLNASILLPLQDSLSHCHKNIWVLVAEDLSISYISCPGQETLIEEVRI